MITLYKYNMARAFSPKRNMTTSKELKKNAMISME